MNYCCMTLLQINKLQLRGETEESAACEGSVKVISEVHDWALLAQPIYRQMLNA